MAMLPQPSSPSPLPLLDYASLLAATSQRRQPSAIRALRPLIDTPGMISLGSGMPAPQLYPFEQFTAKCPSPLPNGPASPSTNTSDSSDTLFNQASFVN